MPFIPLAAQVWGERSPLKNKGKMLYLRLVVALLAVALCALRGAAQGAAGRVDLSLPLPFPSPLPTPLLRCVSFVIDRSAM